MTTKFRLAALALGVLASLFTPALLLGAEDIVVTSPGGNVQFKLLLSEPKVRFSVTLNKTTAIEPSPMVFLLDGVNLADSAEQTGKTQLSQINETYSYRGVHSKAVNHCNAVSVPMKHGETPFTIEIRAYDDGVAYRTIVPGEEKQNRVPDEMTVFTLPQGCTVWHHDMGGHYEALHKQNALEEIQAGEWCAPPMTFKLPNGGYGSISEANLVNYSGMSLQADGKRGFVTGLAHRQPISHPYELRFPKSDQERLSHPAVITGTITTPWRVVLLGADLNALVNSDVIPNCCPAPDPKYFPQGNDTEWTKPVRAVWLYTDGGDRSYNGLLEYGRLGGQLGFEMHVVEGMWRRWSDDDLRNFVETSRKNGLRVMVWVASRSLHDVERRQALFKHLHDFGVAGCKIDFFDHEHKETIDVYQGILRDAAEQQLVLDFHGANKPTGEPRTWPNELTREAVRGMESSRTTTRALHETTLPFTRFLAGHAEYTVVHWGARRGDTTAAHQLATAAILTASMLTYSLNPQTALQSPAADMIKSIPATWDQTIVLPPSEIGQIAVFARRSGDTWFLAVANGPAEHSVKIPLSFLGDGQYKAMIVKDGKEPSTQPKMGTISMSVENGTVTRGDTVSLDLAWGGGYIAKFSK